MRWAAAEPQSSFDELGTPEYNRQSLYALLIPLFNGDLSLPKLPPVSCARHPKCKAPALAAA